MPWKDGYTISDEKSLADADLRWPEGKRCAVHIVVDLSVASGPEGIGARDIKSAPAEFGANQGLDLVLAQLDKHGLRATFAVPAVTAEIYPAQDQDARRARTRGGGARLQARGRERSPPRGGKGAPRPHDRSLDRDYGTQAGGLVLVAEAEGPVCRRHDQPQHHGPADRRGLRLHGQRARRRHSALLGHGLREPARDPDAALLLSLRRSVLLACSRCRARGWRTRTCCSATGEPSSMPSTSAAASSP